jgi:serine/threonine-protein kinase RsbW
VGEPSQNLHLAIENDLGLVGGANRSLEDFLTSRNVDPELIFPVTLAFEEIVTNVIKYSYDDDRAHRILIDAEVGDDRVALRVTDDGRPFDPLDAPPPDRTKPREERAVGGLGIDLIRHLARGIEYRRISNKNVLTLFFPFNANP